MPFTLTMIPKTSAEVNPETAVRKHKNTKKHHKTKHRQSTSPPPPLRRHQDTPTTTPSGPRNPRHLHSQGDPFSITDYIHDQVHTAVRRIPGIRWLTDTVSHPIIVAREKLDKFDENMSQRRNNKDGSWLYPKGSRKTSKTQREIDIDSLKRSHKKKVRKEEKRKMQKASPEKRMSRTEVREMTVFPERKSSGDSFGFAVTPGSKDKLFTIEDVNASGGSSRKRYRPKNLVKVTPSFSQDTSATRTKLPTREEFRFSPRLLRYESDRQSDTICNVASSFDYAGDITDRGPQEYRDYHLLTSDEESTAFERSEGGRTKEMRKSWSPNDRDRINCGSLLNGYPRRNFRQDVNFIGVEQVEPFSSSEEAISERSFPKKRDLGLNFARNVNLNHNVCTSVKLLPEEQVFETGHPIRKPRSGWPMETTHNGCNDFSDENFLSMPKYVQVLPINVETGAVFSNLMEERNSARKYPKPRMQDEFEGLFVDKHETVDAFQAHEVEKNTPEELLPEYAQNILSRSGETSPLFSNLAEEQSFSKKYPNPRMQDRFEGLFDDQLASVDVNKAHKFEKEQSPPQLAQMLPLHRIGSSAVFSNIAKVRSSLLEYPQLPLQDEFDGSCDGKDEEGYATYEIDKLAEVESLPASFPVFLLPSSRRVTMTKEQNPSKLKHSFNVFQFKGASTHQLHTVDEERPQFEPNIMKDESEEVLLEQNKFRTQIFEIKHEETDKELEDFATLEVSGHSGCDKISESDGISRLGENAGYGGNSGLDENCELGGNFGLIGMYDIDETSGLDENHGNGGSFEPRISNIRESVDISVSNIDFNLAEENKEDSSEHDQEEDKMLRESCESDKSDVDDEYSREEKQQELAKPSKTTKGKRYMAEKLNLLHGNIEQLGSGLEELDILQIDKQRDTQKNHDKDIMNEPPDNKEGLPQFCENFPVVENIGTSPTYKFGVIPQRKRRHHLRDHMMSPSTVLKLKQQKLRTRDSSQSQTIGRLANGLYKAIVQNGFGPKLKSTSPENNTNSPTNTAASLNLSTQQTVNLATSSSKIKKKVSFSSQLSSECDAYSTDGDSSDSQSPSKSSSCRSPTYEHARDNLDLAVVSIINMPPTLGCNGEGKDADSSCSETASMLNTTSGVLYMQHRETSLETNREKVNSYHNFPPLDDDRRSDEAKDTASEFGISSSETESEDERKIEWQSRSKRIRVPSFLRRQTQSQDSSNEIDYLCGINNQKIGLGTRLSSTKEGPRWYKRLILGKRLSRVGPSRDPLPSRSLPTPKQMLVNAALLRATML